MAGSDLSITDAKAGNALVPISTPYKDSASNTVALHLAGFGIGGVATPVDDSHSLPVAVTAMPTTAVTGAFYQATQPVSGAFYQNTQPVSLVSAPLPTGAATSAKQAAPGTAGTPSTDVLTMQGAVGGTPFTTAQPSNLATNQVPVGATATLIVAARAGRRSVLIIQEGTAMVRVGASGVSMATGAPLPGTQYASLTLDGGAAVYGIVASGTQNVSFVEAY